jgi:hypothetical protein
MVKNKKKLISWLVPRKTTKCPEGDLYSNRALILFEVGFEVYKEGMAKIMEKPSVRVTTERSEISTSKERKVGKDKVKLDN